MREKFKSIINYRPGYAFCFMLGSMLGAAFFVSVFGLRILDFTYNDWLLPNPMMVSSDVPQHYLGQVTYWKSAWHFPFGLMDNIVYPDKLSVIYTDSIPLFAFVFKLMAPILPEAFQCFGLFGLVCYMMQGGFGALIVRKWTYSWPVCAAGSMVFVISVIMVHRLYHHTGLAAHWLILAGICIWMYYDRLERRSVRILLWAILNVMALLTQAYFIAMTFGIMLCCLLEQLIRSKRKIGEVSAVIVLSSFAMIAAGYLFGLFYGDVPAGDRGLGYYSWNLNGFFNSLTSNTSKILEPLALGKGQREGFSYLGAGMLLLVGTAVVRMAYLLFSGERERIFDKKITLSVAAPKVVFVICFAIAAASNVIMFGNHTLTVPLPEKLLKMWATFRCSGRLIWPVYYGIIAVSLYLLVKNAKRLMPVFAVLVCCIVLQLYDTGDVFGEKGAYTKAEHNYESVLQSSAWDEIAKEYRHLVFYPNTYKLFSNDLAYHFQVYTLKNQMSVNMTYLSRNIAGEKNQEVLQMFEKVKRGSIPEDTFYVFLDEAPPEDAALFYYEIDGILVGFPKPLSEAYEGFGRRH